MLTKIQSLRKEYEKVESPNVGEFNMEESTALLYHENSKLDYFGWRMLGYNIQKMDNEYIHLRASQPYKMYSGSAILNLKNNCSTTNDKYEFLKTLIENRRSARTFDDYKITETDLHSILFNSYGINQKIIIKDDGTYWGRRAIPSAGALYPLELYVLVLNGSMQNGLYHYRPDMNYLELIKEGDFHKEIQKVIVVDSSIDIDLASASALVITTSVFERNLSKYLERGYRFIMIEVGAVGQMLTMMCETIGLNSCYVGSFWDDYINDFIGLDGIAESVQAVLAIGKKKS